jgi:predicted AAA+ superfamily ATPase
VVLNGARQTGKSTLARVVAGAFPGSEFRYLDEAPVRAAAQADPSLFVRHDGLLVIDEVQRVPDLFLAIKHRVDIDPRPGQFLLTGSARLLGLQEIPDLLPGRTETVELFPLAQGEIDRSPDGFAAALFRYGVEIRVPSSDLCRDDYLERALRGGYPEAVRRTDPGRRARFFESYITDLVNRDVRQLTEIERPADMRRLVNLIAASTASPAVPAAMANRLP